MNKTPTWFYVIILGFALGLVVGYYSRSPEKVIVYETINPADTFTYDQVVEGEKEVAKELKTLRTENDTFQSMLETGIQCPEVVECDCSPDYKEGHEDGMTRANLINNQYAN